jgi:hypothetical protein
VRHQPFDAFRNVIDLKVHRISGLSRTQPLPRQHEGQTDLTADEGYKGLSPAG